jgi:Predicted ATPase with chaperone activity
MPTTKRNHPSTGVPLRRSSPRLMEKNRTKQYSHNAATGTAAAVSLVATQSRSAGSIVNNNKLPPLCSKKPTNPPILSRQRGKDIGNIGSSRGGEQKNEGMSGGTSTRGADRSLRTDFEEENGSDTDSFVSTLGFLKDVDGSSGDEGGKLAQNGDLNRKGQKGNWKNDNNDSDGNDDDAEDQDDNVTSTVMSPVLLLPETKKKNAIGKSDAGKMKKSSRSSNYTELEDLLITKAYVSVSEDPINGSQQRANIFWAKVHQKYQRLLAQQDKNNQPEIRSLDSVKQRYTKFIQKETVKFNKFYVHLKKQNKSGWTEDNYLEEAGCLYEDEYNKPFNFMACLLVLHKHPKFDPMVNTGNPDNRSMRVNNTHPPQGAAIPRPIGTKKAKIVQYLKESGVVVGQTSNDNSMVDSSIASINANNEITKRMDRNYRQRERQMKLSRIDLYLKMNDISKARELMKEVEEETSKEVQEEEHTNPFASAQQEVIRNVQDQSNPHPPMPPLNEIVVDDNIVESQLTNTQI